MSAVPATEPEVAALLGRLAALRAEIAKVIVGQAATVDEPRNCATSTCFASSV